MNSRILMTVLLIPLAALAAEEPIAQSAENRAGAMPQAADPYIDFNKRIQERLKALGFYAGPVNGDPGPNTQAALVQFQLSVPLPASGALDDPTLAALGVERSVQASAGGSVESSVDSSTRVEAGTNADAPSGSAGSADVKGN